MALIAVLEASEAPGKSANRERRQLVCVANTHVHSNPELTDVKLWQALTQPRRPPPCCRICVFIYNNCFVVRSRVSVSVLNNFRVH